MPYRNAEDKREAARRNYLANKEKFKERARAWKKKNREKVRAYVRKWAAAHKRIRDPEKMAAYAKKWRRANIEKSLFTMWKHDLKRHYGVTPEWYASTLAAQNGACSICGTPPERRRLCVDHDHGSGRVRGLLCTNCNRLLGSAKDSRATLERAIAYLQTHGR